MTVRIGVEEEFHVLDVETGELVPRAETVLRGLPEKRFTAELLQSAVETNSDVHTTLDGLLADLRRARGDLRDAASRHGLAVVAAGTVPFLPEGAARVTPDSRYRRMVGEYGLVAQEQSICGLHVHAEVPERDTAVRMMCLIAPWIPALLALSASSPFWKGADTGYASWRTMVWQRWPTSGPVGCYPDARAYQAAVTELIDSGVVSDPGMIYYDLRPSDHQPTLELRVCDAAPRAETSVLIAALFRALVMRAGARLANEPVPRCPGRHEWLRAATWRAARSGLEGDLIDPVSRRPAPAARVIRTMLTRLRAELEACGDWETVSDLTDRALVEGSAAHRIRQVAAGEDLLAAIDELAVLTGGGERSRRRPAAHALSGAPAALHRGHVEPIGG
ncbi:MULTISPECIES: carboxylate-amine ligase [Streptomyces]|uniref:carboxylate-amine ligase n=1 Tax=Streptomyces TaxID=1883 RepID=UPI0007CD7CB0|nr:glutamate--cysteine ligase [Streptomyces noursei]